MIFRSLLQTKKMLANKQRFDCPFGSIHLSFSFLLCARTLGDTDNSTEESVVVGSGHVGIEGVVAK
jgi:hypothetical protein